jgi:hypothetical protein
MSTKNKGSDKDLFNNDDLFKPKTKKNNIFEDDDDDLFKPIDNVTKPKKKTNMFDDDDDDLFKPITTKEEPKRKTNIFDSYEDDTLFQNSGRKSDIKQDEKKDSKKDLFDTTEELPVLSYNSQERKSDEKPTSSHSKNVDSPKSSKTGG